MASAFTGILFSQTSSDSRTSNTVLAGTKGGMFSLKKKNTESIVLSDKKLFCSVSESLHLRTEMKESYSDHIGGGKECNTGAGTVLRS